MSATVRLTFLLPPALGLVPPGRHQPCVHGCVLKIAPGGLVSIEGPSREQVFEQTRRFLRLQAKGRPPMTIAATLYTPVEIVRGGPDPWTIIVNAEIAFAPTARGADVHPLPAGAPRVA